MKTRTLHSLAASLLAMSALFPGVLLAGDKTPPAVSNAPTKEYDLQIVDGSLIRPGGKVEATLPNVVDALRDQFTDANIIVAPALSKLKVGDLKLRAGRLSEELEGVRVACGEKFEVQPPGNLNGPVDPSTGLPVDRPHSIDSGLYVLRELTPTPQTQRIVEAFNIGPYLDWLSHRPTPEHHTDAEAEGLDQISQVILATIHDLKGESDAIDQPKWQYHRGSTLLVLIGTVESVEVARKIINALPGMSGTPETLDGRFGTRSPRYEPPNRATKNAEDAFRARYGLGPHTDTGTSNPAPATGK